MSDFLNLSSVVINKSHIVKVVKENYKFTIYTTIIGHIGYSTVHANIIEITHRNDYEKVLEWINSL